MQYVHYLMPIALWQFLNLRLKALNLINLASLEAINKHFHNALDTETTVPIKIITFF